MAFFIRALDEGNFELLDGELEALYPEVDFSELMPLTDEQYQEFCQRNNGLTKFIDGQFVYKEPITKGVNITELITLLTEKIDATAAGIIEKWTRFRAEYEEREAAALAFKQADYQGEVSIYISSFSHAAGISDQQAAELILRQAAGLRSLLESMAALRMRKYELKHTNLTIEQLQEITADIIGKMEQLAEAFNG